MNPDEMIAIIQAYKDGKNIQRKNKNHNEWFDGVPYWNFADCEYRVKPRKPREIWVNIYSGDIFGLIHKSKEKADSFNCGEGSTLVPCVKFVEVIDES